MNVTEPMSTGKANKFFKIHKSLVSFNQQTEITAMHRQALYLLRRCVRRAEQNLIRLWQGCLFCEHVQAGHSLQNLTWFSTVKHSQVSLWTCTGWSQSSEPHLVQHSQTQSSQFVNMYRLVTVFRTSPGSAQSNTVKSVCEHVQAGHSLQNLTWFSTVKHSQVSLWTCTGWSQSSEPHLVQHSQTQSSHFVNMYRLVTVFRTSPGSAQSNTVKSVCEHVQAGHSLQNLTWFSTVKHSQVSLWTCTGWSQSSEPHLVQHSQTQSSQFVNMYRLVTVFRTSPGSAQSNTVKSVCEHVQAGHSLQNLTWFSTVKHSQVSLWTCTGWSQSSEPHLVQHSQTQSSQFHDFKLP